MLLYLSWTVVGLIGILFILSIHQTVKFVLFETKKSSSPNVQKSSKSLKYTGFIFFIISCLLLPLWATLILYPCHPFIYKTIRLLPEGFYFLQTLLLWLLLFIKVYVVFKPTAYALSSDTFNSTLICFGFSPLLFIFVLFWGPRGWIALFLVSTIIAVSLSFFFVRKLGEIFKNTQRFNEINDDRAIKENNILGVMTKTTILAFISMIFSVIVFIWVCIYVVVDKFMDQSLTTNIRWDGLVTYTVILFEIYNKFICVMLSYIANKTYYYKLCGGLDKKCRSCIFNMVMHSYDEVEPNDVENDQELAAVSRHEDTSAAI